MGKVTASLLTITFLLLTSCGGLSPEIIALAEVEPGENKIVCFKAEGNSPLPGSTSNATIGILSMPETDVPLTQSERIAAMNACF